MDYLLSAVIWLHQYSYPRVVFRMIHRTLTILVVHIQLLYASGPHRARRSRVREHTTNVHVMVTSKS